MCEPPWCGCKALTHSHPLAHCRALDYLFGFHLRCLASCACRRPCHRPCRRQCSAGASSAKAGCPTAGWWHEGLLHCVLAWHARPACLLPPVDHRRLKLSPTPSCSPLLWRKLPGARSAGRVQSAALRLLCDREAAIEAFQVGMGRARRGKLGGWGGGGAAVGSQPEEGYS